MSKLTSLKEWLTLEDAAAHLTDSLGEKVHGRDLVQLALGRSCVLSIYLFEKIRVRTAKLKSISPKSVVAFVNMKPSVDDLTEVNGLWDLTLFGAEKHYLEQYLSNKSDSTSLLVPIVPEGIILARELVCCQLLEQYDSNARYQGSKAHNDYVIKKNSSDGMIANDFLNELERNGRQFLAGRYNIAADGHRWVPGLNFPASSQLCIRVSELKKIEEMPAADSDRAMDARERNSLLVLIATLCDEANINYSERGMAAVIERATQVRGTPVSHETIRKILKTLPDAVESKSK